MRPSFGGKRKQSLHLHFLFDSVVGMTDFLNLLPQFTIDMVAVGSTLLNQSFDVCRQESGTGRLGRVQSETWPRIQLVAVQREHLAVLRWWIVKHRVRSLILVFTQQHVLDSALINKAVCYHWIIYVQHL